MSGPGIGDLVTAIGLVLVIEGVLLALIPEVVRRMVAAVVAQPGDALRIGGVISAVIGLGIVWLARG
jgi:uncharacterized protein YjeT (DUF2065 family)